jgi:single-stranded DNA-binding protein
MSFHVLVSGTLIGDPVRRTGARGDFATANVRCHTEAGDYLLASIIAFAEVAEELLTHCSGAAIAVSGRATLRTWQGKDGEQKCGLSIVCTEIASVAGARRADADRRRSAKSAA